MAAQPMNGAAAGMTGVGSSNGGASADGASLASKIHAALELVHNPYSAHASRAEASAFLEHVKTLEEAPFHGFSLASPAAGQPPVVRHYGLSLLEHAIRHRSTSPQQARALRDWVIELARDVDGRRDPGYLRAKIAQLWVEVAKRQWAADWMDMDELLVGLWEMPPRAADGATAAAGDAVQGAGGGPTVHKELVLAILETLSDDVFAGDDVVVAMREGVLSRACVEIFTPEQVLVEAFPQRKPAVSVRCGTEGWLERVSVLLDRCLRADVQGNEEVRSAALKALGVLYSLMSWAIPKAISASRCVVYMCNGLAAPNVAVQKASLEALHVLYSRPNLSESEIGALVVPLYDREFVQLCRRLFEWSTVDVNDIDDDKYQFAKKFSEMISCLGNYLERRHQLISPSADLQGFLELLLAVVQSQSLVVSIPVLVTWTRLLQKAPALISANAHLIGPLLDVCSSRLIRYENLPEDTEDPTYVLLLEDTDTIPERHAFLGNYRRYSCQVIEAIVYLRVTDAMYYILGQTETLLSHLYDSAPPLNMASYNKNSMAVLRVDAQFTVVEAALKGYTKWRAIKDGDQQDRDQKRAQLEPHFESWCNKLLEMNLDDPLIRKRRLQLAVGFSVTALDKKPGFMLKVLEHILVTWPSTQPEHKAFNDAIRDLQSESILELQRLASKMPDYLLEVYDQLEAKVKEMVASGNLDEKRQVAYQSFLFIIIHRATRLDMSVRLERLRSFVAPTIAQWQHEALKQSLSSYDAFCELMALDKARDYLARRRIHEVKDWGTVELDAEGLALQAMMEERQSLLPLRSTKSLLSYSVEKIEKDTVPFQAACAIWQDGFPIILPQLLQFLSHAHATHNPANWTGLPPEMRPIVGRVLTDRFWQAGISEGSKDEFYARVMEKKNTMEGFASTIRGTVRFVRETCYAIIYCMTRMDVQFYGFSELPGPLAHALFADSFCLSTHQLINLLNLCKFLVENCPVKLRSHFLPPILAACFQQMDVKINSEWEKLDVQQGVQADSDVLTEEMKAESILRQLTYTAVIMVADFLDPTRIDEPDVDPETGEPLESGEPTLRRFCLMQSSIVAPLLMFCAHAICMRDTRCCSIVLRVFRSIVPEFCPAGAQPPGAAHRPGAELNQIPPETQTEVREFISSDVMKACITSLHEAYFVDLQKELGTLIATIVVYYAPLTPTPRNVLLSLPNMKADDVDRAIELLSRPGPHHHRQRRSIVLELLRDLKGVSISEMHKLDKAGPDGGGGVDGLGGPGGVAQRPGASKRSGGRSKMAQQFFEAPPGAADGQMVGLGIAGDQGQGGAGGQTRAAGAGIVAPENDVAADAMESMAGLFKEEQL